MFDFFFRWVQAECRKLGDTDNPEVGELLKTAVRCLKERPVLFKYCAEEVIIPISLTEKLNFLLSIHFYCTILSNLITSCRWLT